MSLETKKRLGDERRPQARSKQVHFTKKLFYFLIENQICENQF
jgi:hypothetical protein